MRARISATVITLDEERNLGACLASLVWVDEIVVVDGGSTDRTRELSRPLADQLLISSARGRAAQMHAGAVATLAELLVFLHADTLLPGDWVDALERAWSVHPLPTATAFRLCFDRDARPYRLIAWAGTWRARLSRIPYGDQAIGVTRAMYLAAGGFPPVPLMEEYYLLRQLKRRGTVRILAETVTTSARRFERHGWFRQVLRINLLLALFHLGVPLRKLGRLYR